MDVILHIGAHRTATTSFQSYLRANRTELQAQGIGFWAPWRTRGGLLNGIADQPRADHDARRATGRVALNLEAARRKGIAALVVTDENMAGTPRRCLRARGVYPGVGERLARLSAAFGRPTRVTLQIRALDAWWASSIAWLVPRGEGLPSSGTLEAISRAPRSWRDVITDIACACPGTDLQVTAYEAFGDRPDLLLRVLTERRSVPLAGPGGFVENRRPDIAHLRAVLADRGGTLPAPSSQTRWTPFSDTQAARLRETYADDLFWLRAGADGLARLTEDPEPARPRLNLAAAAMKRGNTDDGPARKLAR
ncbi:hypothetical protein [Antarctobacter sp.]|uniref:hypothetical protein n=1 Tax=Antarctobacter sp. TaxID=1872577 RepID=UPI003A95898C